MAEIRQKHVIAEVLPLPSAVAHYSHINSICFGINLHMSRF